jgi:hypothetical protein
MQGEGGRREGGGGVGEGEEGEGGAGGPQSPAKMAHSPRPTIRIFFITNNAGELQISGVALHILPMQCYLRKILQHRYATFNARLVLSETAL